MKVFLMSLAFILISISCGYKQDNITALKEAKIEEIKSKVYGSKLDSKLSSSTLVLCLEQEQVFINQERIVINNIQERIMFFFTENRDIGICSVVIYYEDVQVDFYSFILEQIENASKSFLAKMIAASNKDHCKIIVNEYEKRFMKDHNLRPFMVCN